MRLQSILHLPTRQRNDGHHETLTSRSTQTCRTESASTYISQKFPAKITKSFLLCLPASAILLPGTASAEPKPVGTWGWTTGSATYVRIRPGVQTPVVAKIPRRTQLMVWGTYDGWYRVETTDNKFGWIYHDYVTVPKAQKLRELSHFKAKKASDSTGHQTLYGKPEQLKNYYARYGASGAKRGLEKQGVRLVSDTKAPHQTKPVSARIGAAKPVAATAPRRIVVKTSKPVVKSVAKPVAKPETRPVIISVPQTVKVDTPETNLPATSEPVLATATETTVVKTVNKTSTAPVKTTPRPKTVNVARKAASPRKTTRNAKATTTPQIAPMSPSQLPNITAEDIMAARAAHMRGLSSRRKTRPYVAPKAAPKPAPKASESTPVEATVQPTSFDAPVASPEIIGGVYYQANAIKTSPVPVKNGATSSASPISGKPLASKPAAKAAAKAETKTAQASYSRGGSPRDMAAWAKKNNRFGSGMAKQALSYRGMPYITGASNPRRGFDCSGLVYYLLRQRGYNPPRTAAGMARVGTPVPRNQLKEGDIVFFANTYKRGISHVGIYTGNNNFVHAANRGSGVKTDSLNSAYYRKKYWGARRIK